MYCEKEGFDPLFKAVDLANRYDLMIISNKGLSVTACRKLIDEVCGDNELPLFVLHDFDFDGFKIFGTLQRDTRRYQFTNTVETTDLGLRLADITGLEREPAAATRTSQQKLREQLANNGATEAEIAILLHERVELNAMTSDALVAMIERKLNEYGLTKKVLPDDALLAETYRAFHRSRQLRERFERMESEFEATEIKVPKDLRDRVCTILTKQTKLRWDDAIQIVLGATLEQVQAKKQEAKEKSGDFTEAREGTRRATSDAKKRTRTARSGSAAGQMERDAQNARAGDAPLQLASESRSPSPAPARTHALADARCSRPRRKARSTAATKSEFMRMSCSGDHSPTCRSSGWLSIINLFCEPLR